MPKNKKILLALIVAAALVVAMCFIYLDFSLLFGIRESNYPSKFIKRIDVILAAVVVAAAGKQRLSRKDNLLVGITFLAIFCAEASFIINNTIAAIVFFVICQILLIIRNGNGLRNKLQITKDISTRRKLVFSGAGIMVVLILIITFVFYPILKLSAFFFIFILYGLIVSISLWIGLVDYILDLFPKKNSLMIGIGMICFFVSDIFVGLNIVLKPSSLQLLVSSLIWILYIPAIMLLAFSCYNYSEDY